MPSGSATIAFGWHDADVPKEGVQLLVLDARHHHDRHPAVFARHEEQAPDAFASPFFSKLRG